MVLHAYERKLILNQMSSPTIQSNAMDQAERMEQEDEGIYVANEVDLLRRISHNVEDNP
jgi:hypothetical protein